MYVFSPTVQLRIILTGRSIVDNSPDHFAAPDYRIGPEPRLAKRRSIAVGASPPAPARSKFSFSSRAASQVPAVKVLLQTIFNQSPRHVRSPRHLFALTCWCPMRTTLCAASAVSSQCVITRPRAPNDRDDAHGVSVPAQECGELHRAMICICVQVLALEAGFPQTSLRPGGDARSASVLAFQSARGVTRLGAVSSNVHPLTRVPAKA